MDFALNSDQTMIRDTAAAFLADASSSAAVRAAMAGASGFDAKVWQTLAQELAWCATAIPEEYEGLGLACFETVLLAEQCGRFLLCAPYFATACLSVPVLLETGNAAACGRYLPQIAGGTLTATTALSATGLDWQPGKVAAEAIRQDDHYLLSGAYRQVIDAATAGLLLLPARLPGGETALFAVSATAAGLSATTHDTFDRTRRTGAVKLDQVRADAGDMLACGEALDKSMQRACAGAAIALAAEQVGGAQACLDMTLAYIAERKQFGRSIASFQAIKHRCAEMMVRIEAARSAVHGAARQAATRPGDADLALEAACAKALASDAYFYCAQESIQLHGGVGFTWEYDPHLHFKRAQAGGHWLGSSDELRERVAANLLGAL